MLRPYNRYAAKTKDAARSCHSGTAGLFTKRSILGAIWGV